MSNSKVNGVTFFQGSNDLPELAKEKAAMNERKKYQRRASDKKVDKTPFAVIVFALIILGCLMV